MARRPDPTRKPALIQQTLEFLADKPLSSLTFRSLASALDVSTFTLVYHFGTRAELIHEIVRANTRAVTPEQAYALPADTLDDYVAILRMSWQWTQLPENLHRQRLEFEAGLLEAIERDPLLEVAPCDGELIALDSFKEACFEFKALAVQILG